jgi:hypothetical protein
LPAKWTGSNCCGPWWSLQIVEPSSSGATIVDDPAGGTNKVAKFTVQPQPGSYEQGYPYHSQVALLQDYPDSLAIQGADSWYRWKRYIDPSWRGAPSSYFNWFHEFLDAPADTHKCPGQLNYNYAIGINTSPEPDRWVFQVGYAGVQSDCTHWQGTVSPTVYNGPNVVRGQWQTWVQHIHWSAHDDGHIQEWIDGQLVFDHFGPNIYQHPDGSSGFEAMYWNDYRSNYASTRPTWTDISYLDNVMVGPTAASVGFAP